MEKKIFSIFYSKATGRIVKCDTSEIKQDFAIFGEFAEDYKIIYDVTYIKADMSFCNEIFNYKINLETKLPELKEIKRSSDIFEKVD